MTDARQFSDVRVDDVLGHVAFHVGEEGAEPGGGTRTPNRLFTRSTRGVRRSVSAPEHPACASVGGGWIDLALLSRLLSADQ